MPTDTWGRLRESRRDAVLNAAEDEFAIKGFSRGSLNVIARNARVAKGSLFQYFEDKVDLFGHLVERTSLRIGAAMDAADAVVDWEAGFFPALTTLLDAWADYFARQPRDRALTVRAGLELDPTTRNVITDQVSRNELQFIRPRLEAAHASGWLRDDADLDAFMSVLLLLLAHLAMEPSMRTIDPLFPAADGSSDRAAVRRLVGVFELAFGRHPTPKHRQKRPSA